MALGGLLKAFFDVFCASGSAGSQIDQRPPQTSQVVQTQPQPQPQPQPSSHPVYPPKPPHRPQDVQQNQQNEYYSSLRAKANVQGEQMAQAFQESHEAYARGDGGLAKQLSDEGKEHKRKMESLNKQASDWVFAENNKNREPGEIDLHGLYVKEAIAQTDAAIQQAKQLGLSQLRLIVGKGLHSQGGNAKIKPAIEDLMRKEQLVAELDPHNAGVLIVHIRSEPDDGVESNPPILGPEEIVRDLEKDDGRCVIM